MGPAPSVQKAGAKVGDYKITKVVGKGGFGVVYQVQKKSQVFALKQISCTDQALLEMGLREVRTV